MTSVAVIGSGISGLVSAYLLSRRHTVWLLEQDDRLGGHTHTIRVDDGGCEVALDTGFLVHNTRTYPNLVRLFRDIGVATHDSDMSFSVSCPSTGLEYSSRGVAGFFAQPRNLVRPAHYGMLADIIRFNREAPDLIADSNGDEVTLGEFVQRERYGDEFVNRYLVPMTSAIWSASAASMQAFPMRTMVQFMRNHGMLAVGTQLTWRVVTGGSDTYVRPLVTSLGDRVLTNAAVACIRRDSNGVHVALRDRRHMRFDHVVLACHGDQALALLSDATETERDVLAAFTTTMNEAVLHTDDGVLPRARGARASWNYRLNPAADASPSISYDLNRLQRLSSGTQYCVTLNPTQPIDERRVLRRLYYSHPQFTLTSTQAQARWREVSGANRIHFAGAYWRYGFHEDGVMSAIRVARDLGVEW